MEHIEQKSFGRYRLLRQIGQGGMAEVYLAEVAGPGLFRKRIAIKRLLPHYAANERFVSMLRDEANIAAALRHPHVAEVLDFGEVAGQHYIAMEYIDGVDLATVLRSLRERGRTLPISAALYMARCIADGLHAAHTLKDQSGKPLEVIHRDVSPHNILVSFEGAVKLIDFGVAKAENNSTKTKSGVIKGKLQYMSPEQAQAHPVDGRSDVFSLGMTLYKLLTGRLPFTGRNEYQIYDQILRKEPTPPRAFVDTLPERVDAIVMRSLRKTPDRRFQSAGDMGRVLQLALWDIEPDYGPHELARLIEELRPSRDDYDQDEDDDFGSDESAPVPDVEPLPDDQVDRLTRVNAGLFDLAAGASLKETQAMEAVGLLSHPPASRTSVSEAKTRVTAEESEVGSFPERETHAFHRARTEPRISMPPLAVEAAEVSQPSVRTEQLVGLRRRSWVIGLVLALSGLAGGLLFFAINPGDARDAEQRDAGGRPMVVLPVDPPRADAAVAPRSVAQPTDAPPSVAPRSVGTQAPATEAPTSEPPRPVAPPSRTRRKAPVSRAPRSTPATPRTAAPRTEARKRAATPRRQKGYLTVNALPWANVEVDGRRLKNRTPVRRYPLKPGAHLIRLIAPDGTKWSKRITIRSGKETALGHKF